ncbi:DNA repair protein RadC [Aminiphilus sp.]|uniref:JAB domain-containing protein n=1 Tax=Aminiphilus sp. TaxID=1872488 RepID=UPI001BD0C078|nr:DNA repair protein RadC [Aminiphilus sp.]
MFLARLPRDQWPRERLFSLGPEALSLCELLAILLHTGSRGMDVLELGGMLLEEFGDLTGLARAAPEEFLAVKGLGEAKVANLVAALELARRLRSESAKTDRNETWRNRVASWAEHLATEEREFILALFLDRKGRILGEKQVSYGGLDGAFLDLPFLLRRAVRLDAAAMVLGHNHPDGTPEPSKEDRELTLLLSRRLRVLDMELLGHFVLAGGRFVPVTVGEERRKAGESACSSG